MTPGTPSSTRPTPRTTGGTTPSCCTAWCCRRGPGWSTSAAASATSPPGWPRWPVRRPRCSGWMPTRTWSPPPPGGRAPAGCASRWDGPEQLDWRCRPHGGRGLLGRRPALGAGRGAFRRCWPSCGRCCGTAASSGPSSAARADRRAAGDPRRRVGPARRRPGGLVLPHHGGVRGAARPRRPGHRPRRLGAAAAAAPVLPGRAACAATWTARCSAATTRCCRRRRCGLPGRRAAAGAGRAATRRRDVRPGFRPPGPARPPRLNRKRLPRRGFPDLPTGNRCDTGDPSAPGHCPAPVPRLPFAADRPSGREKSWGGRSEQGPAGRGAVRALGEDKKRTAATVDALLDTVTARCRRVRGRPHAAFGVFEKRNCGAHGAQPRDPSRSRARARW